MQIIQHNEITFPHPLETDRNGILAIGGDLSIDRLLLAYQYGIFPWYNPDEPIIWWSPLDRFIIWPKRVKVSKSMRPYLNQDKYRVTSDQAFNQVLHQCQTIKRNDQPGTWITNDIVKAYSKLHEEGYAHSVEVWEGSKLVGGLYGVSIGKCFFGESMFSKKPNASKFAIIKLCQALIEKDFWLIDCQIENPFLKSMGGESLPRIDFVNIMRKNFFQETWRGKWDLFC